MGLQVSSYPYVLFDGKDGIMFLHYQDYRQDRDVPNNEFYGEPVKQSYILDHYGHYNVGTYNHLFLSTCCAIQYMRVLYIWLDAFLRARLATLDEWGRTHVEDFLPQLLQKPLLISPLAVFRLACLLMLLRFYVSFSLNMDDLKLSAFLGGKRIFSAVPISISMGCDQGDYDISGDKLNCRIAPSETFSERIFAHILDKLQFLTCKPILTSNPSLPQ